MKNLIATAVTELKFILRNCHVTSALYIPIWSFEGALTYDGDLLEITINDGRDELQNCLWDEESNGNLDTAARLRNVLKMNSTG